jgi:hypothetical protein
MSRVVTQLIAGHQSPSADAIYHLPARHGAAEVTELRRKYRTAQQGVRQLATSLRRSLIDQPLRVLLSGQSRNQVAVAETTLRATTRTHAI